MSRLRSITRWARLRGLRTRLARLVPRHVPIAYKFSFAIAVLISIGMTGLGLVILDNQTRLLRSQMESLGTTVAAQLAESAREPIMTNDALSLDVLTAGLADQPDVLGNAVLSENGDVLARAGVSPFTEAGPLNGQLDGALSSDLRTLEWRWPGQGESTNEPLAGTAFISPVRYQDVTAGYVVVNISRAAVTRSVEASTQAIIAATIAMILVGVAMSFWIGRRLSQPINHLMQASRAIGSGDYHYRFLERRNDEIGYLMSAFNDMAAGLLQKQQVEAAFSRYMSPNVAKQVLSDLDQIKLGGQRAEGSVLFADIVGFTRITESMQPHEVAELLNEYFSYIADAGKLYRGTIDKYMGDCAMMVFGVPEPDAEHPFNAVACAVLIQHTVARLNERRARDGLPCVEFRIGINCGEMLAGNMGSRERMQYTVVGDSVNLASRLCSVAGGGEIAISQAVIDQSAIKTRVNATRHKAIRLRGISRPVNTYLVNDLRRPHRQTIERQIEQLLEPAGNLEACDTG